MDNIKLDVKDRKILYQLESDARLPVSRIAKNVGLSREVVNYRISQLEKKGVIEYYVTTIDLVRLGMVFCRTFFRYSHVNAELERQMVDYARRNPYIAWMALGDGDMNLAVVYVLKNLNMLQEQYYDFLYKYGNNFRSHSLSMAFQIYHFKHSYLYKEKDRYPLIVGATKETVDIDELDFKILLGLMENPRISYLDLSNRLKIAVKTAVKRINSLIEKGIILGFRIKINTRVLGYEHHKVFLYLENISKEKMNMLISFLSQSREVIFITVPLGSAHLEFEVIVEGKVRLFEFMRNLSLNFPALIKDYESSLLYSEPFTNYIPQIAFRKQD